MCLAASPGEDFPFGSSYFQHAVAQRIYGARDVWWRVFRYVPRWSRHYLPAFLCARNL